jgi:hypothetical protein
MVLEAGKFKIKGPHLMRAFVLHHNIEKSGYHMAREHERERDKQDREAVRQSQRYRGSFSLLCNEPTVLVKALPSLGQCPQVLVTS